MQTASAEFIAAEAATDRRPVLRAWIDWDGDGYGIAGSIDDISRQVEQVSIGRELKTELPEVVKIVSGRSSADATITIGTGEATDPIRTAAWWYGEDNTASPIYGKPRQFRPVKVEAGFITSAGPQYVTLFTGRTRDIQVDRAAGQVTIDCLDASELFRGEPELPMVLADDQADTGGYKPGLNTTFLLSAGLRKAGFYPSPPARAGAKIVCTMHGSAYPEVGDLGNCYSGLRSPFNFEAGPFLQSLRVGGVDTTKVEMTTVKTDGVAWNFRMANGRQIAMEAWIKVDSGAVDRGVMAVLQVPIDNGAGCGLYVNHGGNLAIYQRTENSGPHYTDTSLNVNDQQWHYVSAYFSFGTNTSSVTVRKDGSTQSFGTPSGFNNSTTFAMTVGFVGNCYTEQTGTRKALLGWIAEAQFAEEDITGSPGYGFTPTATLQAGAATMLATPQLDGSLWDAMQTVAEAEFGILLLDEAAYPRFYTRAGFELPPFDTVQATLTSRDWVKNLVTANPIDSVRNWITLGGVLPKVQATTALWRAEGRVRIPAYNANDYGYGAGVRVLSVGYSGPIYQMDESFIYGATLGLNESGYRAAQNLDGSGGNVSNLSIVVTAKFADHAFIKITNPNVPHCYLVNGEGIAGVPPGQPCLLLWGQPATFDQSDYATGLHVDKRDAASIALYGPQHLALTDNPARQDLDAFDTLADSLLAYLKDPKRALRSVPIRGLLRLQLGDRVRLQDLGGSELDDEFRVTKIETTISRSDGVSQSIDARTA